MKKMKVKLDKITGFDDAIIALHESKRSITSYEIDYIRILNSLNTSFLTGSLIEDKKIDKEFKDMLLKVFKYGKEHITLLRYIDLSITIFDLHRGGMDDLDSHAKRMENRIIRSSTRLANYKNEKSDFYKDKILTLDDAIEESLIEVPNELFYKDNKYVKVTNGWVLEGFENEKDITRGLLPLSIPMSCIFKVNLTEFAHIFKLRNESGTAHPEVKECIESLTHQLLSMLNHYIDREYLNSIPN